MQKAKQDNNNNKELDETSSTFIGYTECQSIGDRIKVEQ
jgi:hypothetical protein